MRATEEPFHLGAIRVDPARGVLVRDGKQTKLEPKLMALLLLFAASPERVLSKDEIVGAVWHGRAIGDDTLAAAVSRLRAALGETKAKKYIETIPKRGYRLLVAAEGNAAASRAKDKDAASDLIARGREAARIALPPSLAQARLYFESAIKAEPKRADAHAGLAEILLTQLTMGHERAATLVSSALAAARAAVAIDESFAPAWSILGMALLVSERDFAAADAALLRAIALDPDLASAHRHRAFALTTVGRFVEAEREARREVELSPATLSAWTDLFQVLLAARRFTVAIAEARRALGLSAQFADAWSAKGWAHHFLGEDREAVDALLQHLKAFGSDEATVEKLARTFKEEGFEKFAAAGADLFEGQRVLFVPRALDIAMLRVQSGETDKAFAALGRAADSEDPVLLVAPFLPHLDRIRNDPRFGALLERVRLVR